MTMFKTIDCTLRDGGNINSWNFTRNEVTTIVKGLDTAKVDIIEVGYKGGSGSNKSKDTGESSQCDPDFIDFLPDLHNSKYGIMISPNPSMDVNIIDEIDNKKISWIRIASYPENVDYSFQYIEHAKNSGFKVSMNLMGTSKINVDNIVEIAKKLKSLDADLFCLADSFGSLVPKEIENIFYQILYNVNIPLGFHGHNNLGLSFTNTLAAIDSGATYIDSSICGMARGAGNLPTEQLLSGIKKIKNIKKYNEQSIIETAEYLQNNILNHPMTISKAELLCGLNDLHFYYFDIINNLCEEKGYNLFDFAEILSYKTASSVDKNIVAEVAEIIKDKNYVI